jgi:hypothetical protein
MSKAPRKFWIIDRVRGGYITRDFESKHLADGDRQYHVIEKSAYDELQAAYKSLATAKDIEVGAKYIDDWRKAKAQADKLAEALERIWDCHDCGPNYCRTCDKVSEQALAEYRGEAKSE